MSEIAKVERPAPRLYTRRDLAKLATVGIVGCALEGTSSAVPRGLLGVRGAMMGGGGGGWTNPYVTDGLVAMWDGEWNAGAGKHDASAANWTDCIGGIVASPVSADLDPQAVSPTYNASEHYFTCTSTRGGLKYDFASISSRLGQTLTFELAGNLFTAYRGTIPMIAEYTFQYDDEGSGNGRFYVNNSKTGGYVLKSAFYTKFAGVNATVACTFDNGIVKLYVNGVLCSTQYDFPQIDYTRSILYGGVGCNIFFFSSAGHFVPNWLTANATLFANRVYNKVLSADQLVANYNADARRFFTT